jgi:putative ABC transport system permease protein
VRRFLRHLQHWLQLRQLDSDLSEEIEAHRAMMQAELERAGVAPAEAARRSRRALGNVTLAREEARDIWKLPRLESVWRDVRLGARAFRRFPGFTAVAVLTLALGIGANTAIFSAVQAVLLRSLPYAQPDELAMLWSDDTKRGLHEAPTSALLANDWRGQSRTFLDMAIFSTNSAILTGGDTPERVVTAFVSANLFSLLRVPAAVGRAFSAEEEQRAERVAVVSYDVWQRRFGGASDAIGRSVVIDGDMGSYKKGPRSVRVVGVMPKGFYFPDKNVQIWEPATVYWRWENEYTERFSNDSRRWGVVGRLSAYATAHDARAEMAIVGQRLAQVYPVTDPDFAGFNVTVVPVLDHVVGRQLQLGLWVLLAAVGCLLLIACANVANLLLARGVTRGRELAIRTALGAGRARLVRQLLIESSLLALAGGLAGLWLASAAVRILSASALPGIPRLEDIRIDAPVLIFTTVLSLAAALVFGLVPAWKMSRTDPNESLKEGGIGFAGGGRLRHARGTLVVIECALAVLLFAGAGLMIRSFLKLQAIAPGFNPESVLLVRTGLTPGLRPVVTLPRDSGAAMFATREDLFSRVSAHVSGIGGVRSVGLIGSFLLSGAADESITVEGRSPDDAGRTAGELATMDVDPGFFQTMGVPLVRGRFFTRADALDKIRLFFQGAKGVLPTPARSASAEAAIVNQTFVRRFFPAEDPIGKRFYIGELTGKYYWYQIVGVVDDMHRQGLERQPVAEWYGQLIGNTTDLVVRTDRDPLALASTITDVVRSVDKHLMVISVTTVEDRMGTLTAPRRFQTWLLALFAVVALTLATTGIYGIVRYSVSERTREIGVRMAFGADRHALVRLVTWESLRLPIVGLSIGLAGASVATRLMSHLLFDVSAVDPATFGAVGLLLALVAFVACWLPARKAARVDPILALRHE